MTSNKNIPRNIIICADGTGNKGGSSPDSNVYRVYKMINKHYKGSCADGIDINEQILFYDNGVGTAQNKLVRAVSAGIGLGFKNNVCDLYKFLARNYREGDRVFFFGFSRGASTVRACNGMIAKCGLVRSEGLRNSELTEKVEAAYNVYKNHKKNKVECDAFRENKETSWGAVPIQFLGVWDTVVALGFPKRTDITDPLTLLLNVSFSALEKFFDFWFPHSFYHYKLTDNVNYACQALAIDDERTAFWPYVWQERNIEGAKDRTPDNVQQVWFTGMHANVGGGYERDGLAGIPLYWVMKQAQEKGLIFNDDAMRVVKNTSHVHGRMYDTRLGLKMIYRYHPREIGNLCKDKKGESILLDKIKIHSSVIERMMHRTANYVPTQIPENFDVVDNESMQTNYQLHDAPMWDELRSKVNKIVLKRKWLYSSAATVFLTVFGFTIYYWNTIDLEKYKNSEGKLFQVLDYFTPDMFNGLISVLIKNPEAVGITLGIGVLYYFARRSLRKKLIETGESIRHIVIGKAPNNH